MCNCEAILRFLFHNGLMRKQVPYFQSDLNLTHGKREKSSYHSYHFKNINMGLSSHFLTVVICGCEEQLIVCDWKHKHFILR